MPIRIVDLDVTTSKTIAGRDSTHFSSHELVEVTMSNHFSIRERRPHSEADQMRERLVDQHTKNAYTTEETDALFDAAKEDYVKRVMDVNTDRVKNVTDLIDRIEGIERDAREFKEFTRNEFRRVIKSIQEMTPSEAEELFGSMVSAIVKNALVTASTEHAKQMEVINSRLGALEARP